METVKNNKLLWGTAFCCSLLAFNAGAKEIDTNMAQMQAMDKITGKVSLINVPVNGSVNFGSFSIVVRACKTRPPEETPENFAFVDVVDDYDSSKPVNIFRGWMMSSTPALNPVEHPIYDVWLLKCKNEKIDRSKLLSDEELKARDSIEKAPKIEEIKEKILKKQPVEGAVVSEEEKSENIAEETAAPTNEASEIMEEKNLENSAIINPESLIENEENEIKEDGAPQSLLNIGSFSMEKPLEERQSSEQADTESDVSVVEKVIIGQETENAVSDDNKPLPEPEDKKPEMPKALISEIVVSDVPVAEENEKQSILFEE